MNCQGNTVLITGGGSGIGLAFARTLARRNNRVIVCGRDEAKLQRVREENSGIEAIPCDIRREDHRNRLAEMMREKFPSVNWLINNAAVYYEYPFAGNGDPSAKIDEEIAVNLTAPIQLTRLLLPMLKQNTNAAVVNITSAISRVVHPPAAVYCASKAGLSMFTQALRDQLKDGGVRVFEVSPPCVETDMCREAKGRISPRQVADETLKAMERDVANIYVGKTKWFYLLNRFSPALASRVIGRI